MQEISCTDCEFVAGGNPIALLGFGLAVLSQAGAIQDFCSGVFDGFSRL